MADLLSVSINFETSHLLFPKLIGAILLLLGAAMCLVSAWLGHLLVKAERAAA